MKMKSAELTSRRIAALKKHLDGPWTEEEIQAYYARVQKYNLRGISQIADWMRSFRAHDSTLQSILGVSK
jgi:hypothetical protein